MITLGKTRFQTELQVRPDDIDMNQHVHGSRYFDYILAARYDQMQRCYGMSMEEFIRNGFGWFASTFHIEYKRALKIGEWFVVTTWIEEMYPESVRVNFEIHRRQPRKLVADGYLNYTMVRLDTGRAEAIPEWIAAKYAI